MSDREAIRIAGITIRVHYEEESLRRLWSPAAAHFLIEDAGVASGSDMAISVGAAVSTIPPTGRLLFDSGSVWRCYEDAAGYRIDCASESFGAQPYKTALFDRDFREGRVVVRRDAYTESMHPLDYPLDEVIIAHLLGRGLGVELHGCGIIDRDGRGQLFAGQSGAGKTTTARVWLADGDYEIVSDDRVIVRFLDGEWRMFGTPWHGEAQLSASASAPLAGIHLLAQSQRTELVVLPPARATAMLFGCTFPPFYDPSALTFTLECLERLVRDLPVRMLRFVPDRSVIDCVRSAA
jgi:hypothetical protein